MRLTAHTGRRQRGVAIIEFALLLVFLLLVAVGITELGRALWYYSALQKAARDGARCASVVNLSSTAATDACRQLAADTANAAGVWPQVDRDNNVRLITSDSSSGSDPEYVRIAIRNYSIRWIWTLGDPLPGAGGSTGLQVAAAMPYMGNAAAAEGCTP